MKKKKREGERRRSVGEERGNEREFDYWPYG